MKQRPINKPPFLSRALLGWLLPDDWHKQLDVSIIIYNNVRFSYEAK